MYTIYIKVKGRTIVSVTNEEFCAFCRFNAVK